MRGERKRIENKRKGKEEKGKRKRERGKREGKGKGKRGKEKEKRTFVQNAFEIGHLLKVGPSNFLRVSEDGVDLGAETVQDRCVANEEEAGDI